MSTLHFFQFTENLITQIKSQMQDDPQINIHDTVRNNGVSYCGMTIIKKGSNISPNIPLEGFYEDYCKGMELDQIAAQIISIYEEKSVCNMDLDAFLDYAKAKEHIMFRLVSYNANKAMLEMMPHRRFLDLAITYYYDVDMDFVRDENASIQITHEYLKAWGITIDELMCVAEKNTLQKLPVRSRQIADLMIEMMCQQMGEDFLEMDHEMLDELKSVPLYVYTNLKSYYGASVLCYPDLLKDISDKWETDLLIIPSSVHEILVFPMTGEEELQQYNEMIQEVNEHHLLSHEVLSDHLYYYDRAMDRVLLK